MTSSSSASLNMLGTDFVPADHHDRGGILGYADGQAAHQRWKRPKVFRQYGQEPANAQDQADLDFLLAGLARK